MALTNLKAKLKHVAKQFMRRDEGLALIMVMSLIVVVLSVMGEIIFQSEVTSRAAVGERDKVRAEISALTGAQFATMLVLLDSAIGALPPEIKTMVSAQLGDMRIGKLLDGIPLGAESFDPESPIGAQTKDLFSAFDEGLVNALKSIPGYFVLTTTDESGKLNVNLLAQPQYKDTMKEQLTRLFSGERETKFLEEKNLSPQRLVANLVDYVDKNTTDEIQGGDESAEYTSSKFEHGPKNGPFESLEELRRVPGFSDDEVYGIFTPYLTVWPMAPEEKSLNINIAPIEMLAALSASGRELNDETFDKIEDDRFENKTVTDTRSVNEFIDTHLGATTSAGIKRLATIESNVFKIEVRGVSNGVERVYVMVLDRSKNKNVRDAPPVRLVYQRFL